MSERNKAHFYNNTFKTKDGKKIYVFYDNIDNEFIIGATLVGRTIRVKDEKDVLNAIERMIWSY